MPQGHCRYTQMLPLKQLITKAIEKRKGLLAHTDAVRLVNGAGDGCDGLLIDRYAAHISVQLLHERWRKQLGEIQRILEAHMPVKYLIVKSRQGLDITTEVLIDGDATTVVSEYGLKFAVDLNDGLNAGLFLDMRANRHRVGVLCKDKKVLNCFAYTCSFGVHARKAVAAEVINVDISKKILERGRHNYALNQIEPGKNEFIKADSIDFLTRAVKKQNYFDVIILDPPSFARHEGGVFQVKRDLPKLIALSISVLNPGGILFVSTNYSELTHGDLKQMVSKNLNNKKIKILNPITQDTDFPGTNTIKESHLVGVLVQLL